MLNIYGEKEDGYTKRGMAPQGPLDPDMPEDVIRRKGMSEEGFKPVGDDYGNTISLNATDFKDLALAGRGADVKLMVKGTVKSAIGSKVEVILWDAMVIECEHEEDDKDEKKDIADYLMGKVTGDK